MKQDIYVVINEKARSYLKSYTMQPFVSATWTLNQGEAVSFTDHKLAKNVATQVGGDARMLNHPTLQCLEGAVIEKVDVGHPWDDGYADGGFVIHLQDGRSISLWATGDDMTYLDSRLNLPGQDA